MTKAHLTPLKQWIAEMARLLAKQQEPDPGIYAFFQQEPERVVDVVDLINEVEEKDIDDEQSCYTACIFALDIGVAQLQAARENGVRQAEKNMTRLMDSLAITIASGSHSLGFWLPVLNAFYEVHVELSPALKEAYLELANQEEDEPMFEEDASHLNAIRDLIHELSDLSLFDIAENFFAQSYAMPPEFFSDLVIDLYSIEEGQDIALLTLLHPKKEVRDVVIATHEVLMKNMVLSALSLSRLQHIKQWYPPEIQMQLERWIKWQRKKGVVLNEQQHAVLGRSEPDKTALLAAVVCIKASEVDGVGAQGIFIHLKQYHKHRICGLLLKQGIGIKDAWITPLLQAKEVSRYYSEACDESVMLREVDLAYLSMMVNHFLAITRAQGKVPDLHFLEIEEALGVHWQPTLFNVKELMAQLAIQIHPFTPQRLQDALQRSKSWSKNKRFTESWFLENAQIDKVVNRYCSFVDGIKVCSFDEAMTAVFSEEIEPSRDGWLFHFLWTTLWLKASARKNEKTWEDSFFIAYAIQSGTPLSDIPIMQVICHESIVNSMETMQERRTHLTRE